MSDYEKLGAFYLGRRYDMDTSSVTNEATLYDAKDLTTHALIVGMTGSGKTGLGVGIIEEAAIDGLPVLAIDPKGDMGNALLTFPKLRGSDFLPWIDPSEATRKGRTPQEHADFLANLWKKGLGDWGQAPARIKKYAESADRVIYTPGSSAGIPVAVLKSFAAPAAAVLNDGDALRDRIMSAVSGLLGLIGVNADPVRSREHILLSNIMGAAWKEGRDLDIPSLIRDVQSPPFTSVGVFDLESFFPSDDRLELAMMLNNLLASPGFAAWTEGVPMDIQSMLYTPEGKPRVAVVSIAHLSEEERMFFVTLLLNEFLSWTRSQAGSSSLRAILYMDEVFGYFPPTANPPSKRPMLTLLKQARAYGVGVVLSTQNPVDLDYKGLSNIGTWFLGRLQTERDKARVLEGLEGAAASSGGEGFDKAKMEQTLAGLGKRVFLMNNVHEDGPEIFHTRWVLSYLGGPMTRQHIERLMDPRKAEFLAQSGSKPGQSAGATASTPMAASPAAVEKVTAPSKPRPIVPPDVIERFFPVQGGASREHRLLYRPGLFAQCTIHYAKSTAKVDTWEDVALFVPLGDKKVPTDPWEASEVLGESMALVDEAEDGFEFAPVPSAATDPKRYKTWDKKLKTHLYQNRPLVVYQCKALKLTSEADESQRDFQARLTNALHEHRDLQMEKLRAKYAPKVARIKEQIQTAEHRVERESTQASQQKLKTAMDIGTTVLGALFGRKLGSVGNVRRASTSMRSAGRVGKEKEDIARAREKLETLTTKLAGLEEEFKGKLAELQDELVPENFEAQEIAVNLRKSDLTIDTLALAWAPWRVDGSGIAEKAY